MRATTTTETVTAVITGTTIQAEAPDWSRMVTPVIFAEPRPANLAAADTALAAHSLGRTGPWDLGDNGTLTAPVERIDNRFNGTRAARLDQAIGTTHGEMERAAADSVQDGDLVTDGDSGVLYVVAGSSPGWVDDGPGMKIHMVGEGQTWNDRYTGHFGADQPIWVARRTS